MSDLISRSYVIDLLYKTFDEYRIATDKTSTLGGFGSEVFKRIREMPTAYSVDNVVEELEEIKSNGRYVQGNKAGQKIGYRNAIDDFVKSIEEECGYDADINDDCYFEISRTTLLHLAEQLKAGVRNE